MDSGILGALGALAVTVGVLVLLVHLLKRVQRGGGRSAANGFPLRLLKRIPIGPKQGVGLLQVGDRVLVVSIADGGIHLLTELGDSLLGDVLAKSRTEKLQKPQGFRAILMKKLLPLSVFLLLLAGSSSAVDSANPAVPNTAASTASPSGDLAASPPGDLTGAFPIPPRIDIAVGEGEDKIRLSGAVGLVVFMGFLTLLPALLLLMTSFTRILIVLHFLRPAIGVQSSPPGQLLAAIAVMLTAVVMSPVINEVSQEALQPYFNGEITQAEAYTRGVKPFREFMLANTGEHDLGMFTELTGVADDAGALEEIPTFTLVSAFVTSELRTAFQMGFVIFLPFVVVDLVVASVLMSLGMFMLPPMMVSLPFKLLLFVLADGWTLVVKNLVMSFG